MTMRYRSRSAVWRALLITFLATWCTTLGAQEKHQFRTDVLTVFDIGRLDSGRYKLRAAVLTVEPGAEVPYHLHDGPGVRYVLDGAITINWKDGETQTYSAGSTFTEGPGQNHPAGLIAARNASDGVTKILLFELVPTN